MAPRKAATIPTMLPVDTVPFAPAWSPLVPESVPDLPPLLDDDDDEDAGAVL